MFAAVVLAGCTRTYDGSVVPVYQASIVRDGLMPHVVMRRTRVEPAYPLGSYPPPPRRPKISAAGTEPPSRARRRVVHAAAGPEATAPRRPMSCRRETTPRGRVLVSCE